MIIKLVILETLIYSRLCTFSAFVYMLACTSVASIGRLTSGGFIRGVNKGWQLEAELTSNLNPMRDYIVAGLFHSRVVIVLRSLR